MAKKNNFRYPAIFRRSPTSVGGLAVFGKFRLEGKDYFVADGDVLHFRFAN